MRLNKFFSGKELDVWECDCGTFTPVKKGSREPDCEYCRRVKERHEAKK